MNKAFVKEPEPEEPRCPGCGGFGIVVSGATLDAQLSGEERQRLTANAYYCPGSACVVGYFDAWGAQVAAVHLRQSIYPKDPGGPVCACFGVSAEEIRRDAEEGRKEGIRAALERAASAEARCRECSPSGQSCETEMRRLFLRHLER